MGRPKGSRNKIKRQAPRTPYETYSYWYDRYTKGYKAGWFDKKLSKAEFEKMYELAKRAKIQNPARAVAMSQEFVDRKFERQYKKLYGKTLGDITNKAERVKLFEDFIDDQMALGMSYDDARKQFETYFY